MDNDLVGGIATPLKNMSSSVGMIIPNIWKNKTCSIHHQPVYILPKAKTYQIHLLLILLVIYF